MTSTLGNSGASCTCNRRLGELAKTAIDFPPMQKGASFNLQAVKEQVEAAIAKNILAIEV